MQKAEITEHYVYKNIAKRLKSPENKKILETISKDEKGHYDLWAKFTDTVVQPHRFRIFWFGIINFFLGYTFTLKIMEKGEANAKINYEEIAKYVPEAEKIKHDEEVHENELIQLLDEERLNYVGSMVLGLNDALVELTGALAGLTFAGVASSYISLSGLITGIAASFSMAASEYLSAKADGRKDALKSSIYTGIAYIITVAILILPYLLIPGNKYLALGIMLLSVVLIIFFFNYYISVAKDLNFKKRFLQMAAISLSVTVISFLIGSAASALLGI
jgi:VIT1/CCC1 family predicted Fe2+/Mn2+ transporter